MALRDHTVARLCCAQIRLSIILGRAVILCVLVVSPPSWAQKPGETPSPEVAAKVTQRARAFLQEVARLSPMPPGTDPDRAQALPRSETYASHHPGGREILHHRLPGIHVVGDIGSNRHQQGAGWTARLFD